MRAAALLAAVILCSGCRASPTESSSSASSSATSSANTPSLAQASTSSSASGGGPWGGGVPGASGLSQGPGLPGSGGSSSNEDRNDDDDDGSPGSDLRRAFLLSQLGHHHQRRVCIPEIVAFSLLPKGDSAGLFKGALGMWPFHHLSSHKLQELLYLTALSKLLPQHYQVPSLHDDKTSNPLAQIQHPTLPKLPTIPIKI